MNEYDSYSYHAFQANAHPTCNYDFAHPRYCRTVDAILPISKALYVHFYLRAFFAASTFVYGGQSASDLQPTSPHAADTRGNKQDRLQTVVTTCTAVIEECI